MPNPIAIQKHLGGVDYPANKNDLIEAAKDNGADKDVLQALEKLPDREFDGPNAVQKEIF